MADELEQARHAAASGNHDEALVLLWKAVEPARIAEDEDTLGEIAAIAATIPGRESEDLVRATGFEPPTAGPEQQAPPAPSRSGFARALWAVVLVVLVGMIGLAYTRGDADILRSPKVGVGGSATIGADGLYLVPLGRYPEDELREVGLSVIRRAGAVDIRAPLGLGPSTYDADRAQFAAEEMLGKLMQAYSIGDGQTVLIVGVTTLDMYSRAEATAASTPVARSADGRYVVISTHDFGDVRELRNARLRRALLAEIKRSGL
jgi:hypothetical protein